MKGIKTILGIALATTGFGGAIAVGAVSATQNNKVEMAEAATSSVYLAGSFNGWNASSADWKLEKNGSYWTVTKSLSAGDTFKFVVNGGTWVGWGNGISYPNGKFAQAASDGNIECKTSGSYILKAIDGIDSYGDKSYGLVIEDNAVTTYTVTKYAVLDGVVDGNSIGSDVVPETDTYAVPSAIHRAGYHFGGWYTNTGCTTSYTARKLTGNISLYAKYTSLVDDSYIYYVTGSESTTGDYIYTFNGDEQFGGWPGKAITSVTGALEVHGVVCFQGTSQYIYKIPYSTSANDTGLIIHNNSGTQTVNMSLVSHSAYWFITDESLVDYHNDDAGTALDLIFAVEAKRNAVTASGNIAAYSICGISASDAASLYNTYYGLSSSIKTNYIDNSTTYTYDGTDKTKQTNVSFADIMAELKTIALKGSQTVLGTSRNVLRNNNNSTVIIIAIACVSGLSTVGAFFLLKKKKHN